MSNLGNITPEQEEELLTYIRSQLSVQTKGKVSLWPSEFLTRHNITTDLVEREVKILEIDVGYVLQSIQKFNPQLFFYGEIEDLRYDFAPGQGNNIIETVRIRRKNNDYVLTIKKKNTGKELKEREEFEVQLHNPLLFEEAFAAFGLIPIHVKKKVRYSYTLEDIGLDLDLYYGIPPLLEIEGPSKDVIWKWIKAFGLDDHRVVNRSARETLEYYKQWENK